MTSTTTEQFQSWLKHAEDIDIEFKEAKGNFNDGRGTLNDYCAAMANGRGGKLILGVIDKTREVVGTHKGRYKIAIKVVDIFGNDTMKVVEVEV